MAFPIVRTDFDLRMIISSLASSITKNEFLVTNFEESLSLMTNKKYAVFFPKLRFGMEATFNILFSNKIIGVPTYTCSVVPHSVSLSGNHVKFFDSNVDNMTTENYPKDLTSYIVTPWYGSPLNSKIDHIEYSFGDFSHVNIFDLNKFDNNFFATFFSFQAGKPISSIGGGLVSTDDEELYKKLTKARNYQFGDKISTFEVSEIIYSLMGSFVNILNLEKIKIKLDDVGYLDFLREPIDKISLGKSSKRLSAYQIEMLIRNIEKNEYNHIKIYDFWKKTLNSFPIEILNTENWSHSHFNIKTTEGNSLESEFNKLGIQTSRGIRYLNHYIDPYKNLQNIGNYKNAIDHSHKLLQLPINLSEKNYFKLLKNKEKIENKIRKIYS